MCIIMCINKKEVMYVMRTNIVIDDVMMKKAMDISGLKTKREVVERALLEFIGQYNRKNLMELKGKIKFAENYDYKSMRR